MRLSLKSCALWAAAVCISSVAGYDPTDSYMDADPGQSGYLPNHNMDPAVVDSAQFGLLWQQPFNSKEQFYAKPLVFTPSGSSQIVFLASSQNWIRTLDAKNGTVINSRQVHTPFLQADIGCNDIPNTIGITGTPYIDPQTEIAYFFSKTYIPNYRVSGQNGYLNGVYYFHAVRLDTLQDIDGFPILMDGSVADNDPTRVFIGGLILQRPSLIKVGNVVYGGFGGHCDQYNYTGMVAGVDVVQKKIVAEWLAESGPLVPFSTDTNTVKGGGQAGVWQSGFGISTDGNRLFVVTGNGNAKENNGIPASGRSGCQTLGEAVINLAIASNGSLSSQDYFQPYDYVSMDGGDQDFGSSGVALLDPTVFKGTGVNRIGVTAGKNGKWYFINADNLGGYKTGQGGSDGILQYIPAGKAVFGGAGSYPLEGGYVYLTPVGYPTYAYKLTPDSTGKPQFAPVGQTNETSAGRVGVGVPTITSLNGKAGTGILWMTDPDAGLRAWYAVPQSNGVLKSIKMPQIGGVVKFQRPAFGNTRLYTSDSNGIVYCIGSPVNLPLNCSSPVDFGNVALGSVGKATVNCTALIDVTKVVGATTMDAHFVVNNSSLPQGAVKKGASFSFPVTWDLTNTTVSNQQNVSYGYTTPGVKTTPLTLYTTNSIGGYSTSFPISLIGNQVSQKPYLITSPNTVDFGGVILTNNSSPQPIYQPLSIKNAGLQNMTILGYAWTLDSVDGDDDDDDGPDYTNSTKNSNGTWSLGDGFSSTQLPDIGTIIAPGQALAVSIGFLPDQGVQGYYSYFNIWTNGGTTNTILTGSATTAPVANMSISTFEGGWNDVTTNLAPTMDFGTLPANSSKTLSIRICNNGGTVLKISKSKVPNGQFYIPDPTELHEEQEIEVGDCAYGPVVMFADAEIYNSPDATYTSAWTLNTNDLNFGVHVVTTKGTIVAKKVGPTNSTGNPIYTYLGCFQDGVNGRLLPHPVYNGQNTTNAYCQSLCQNNYYIFEGTEFYGECYCGNAPPNTTYQVEDKYCNYPCNGDGGDHCGGDYSGVGLLSVYYDATKYSPGANYTFGAGGLPVSKQVGNYTYIGCFTEGQGGKALTAAAPAAPTNGTTNLNCMSRCSGYMYFGTEYANECYCGNAISNNASVVNSNDPDVNQCNMPCKGNSSEYCGGPSRLTMYQYNGTTPLTGGGSGGGSTGGGTGGGTGGSTLVTQQTAYNGNYNYIGCYLDNVNGRALSAKSNPISGSTVTPDTCAKACAGYQYAGVEYSTECYCDNVIGGNSTLASGGNDPTQNGCNMACGGNSSVYCGGAARLNMYSLSSSSNLTHIVTPVTVGSFGTWSYLGCYTEASNGRALSDLQNPIPSTNVSVENCGAACSNYQYFGVEYAGECYCGNTLASTSNLTAGSTPAQTGCNMLCNANSTEYCGGGSRLNLYKKASTTSSSTSKAVSTSTTASSSSSSAAISTSATTSSSSSSAAVSTTSAPISATTKSTVSSSSPATTSIPTSSVATSTLSTSSVATSTSTSSTVPSSSSTAVTSSSAIASTTTTTSTSTTTTATPTPTGPTAPSTVSTVWKYQGCYTEASNGRALVDLQNPIPGKNVSLEACAQACSGYVYFGTEYSSECYCGNYIRSGSALASGGSDPTQNGCSMTCAANQYEYCGGASRLTLYKSNATAPVTNVTTLQGYTYQGCYQDNVNGRTLSAKQNPIPAANVSVENCATACSGYTYFGVEYGGECYCDNAIGGNSTVVNATTPYDTGCSMLCKANSTEYCGGASRLNLYKANPKSKRDFLEGLPGFW